MACLIEQVSVIAREYGPDGVPVSVDVSGIVTGECNLGRVNVALYDLAGALLASAANVPLATPPNGAFTTRLKVNIACRTEVEVDVQCVHECGWRGPLRVQCCKAAGVTY